MGHEPLPMAIGLYSLERSGEWGDLKQIPIIVKDLSSYGFNGGPIADKMDGNAERQREDDCEKACSLPHE